MGEGGERKEEREIDHLNVLGLAILGVTLTLILDPKRILFSIPPFPELKA